MGPTGPSVGDRTETRREVRAPLGVIGRRGDDGGLDAGNPAKDGRGARIRRAPSSHHHAFVRAGYGAERRRGREATWHERHAGSGGLPQAPRRRANRIRRVEGIARGRPAADRCRRAVRGPHDARATRSGGGGPEPE